MTKSDWEQIKRDYPVGRIVEGTVHYVWTLGVRVEIADLGTIGLVRNQEMSWDEDVQDVTTYSYHGALFTVGQVLRLAVLRVDPHNRQIILSLRRAERDPWDYQGDRYQVDKQVSGKVTVITKSYALVEFEDHISGRLPINEIVPWSIKTIDEVLFVDDEVEAIVTGWDETAREITISMKARFKEISAGLAQPGSLEAHWVSEVPDDSSSDSPAVVSEPAVDVLPLQRPIEQILIVDDDEVACMLLKSILEDLGYSNMDITTDFKEGVRLAVERSYDLVLMDLKKDNHNLEGLQAAEEIQAQKKQLIVLVTGEDVLQIVLNNTRAYISGRIPKPLTHEGVSDAMISLEKTAHAGWPVALKDTEIESVQFVHDISQVSRSHEPLFDVLVQILDKVVQVTKTDRAAVFSMNKRSFQVEMPAYLHLAVGVFAEQRSRLARSPVSDTILRHEHLFENDVVRHEGKYRNLLRLVDFNGCIGIPIEVEKGDVGYALFLLHHTENPFTEADLVRAEAAASMIAQAIREDWLVTQLATEQRLITIGTAITSIGHELKGRLNAFAAVGKLKEDWEKLKKDPNRIADPLLQLEMDKILEGLPAAQASMVELTDVLTGAVRLTQHQAVDVSKSLKSAVDMISFQAARAGITLVPRYVGLPTVIANRLELEQVFMNLLLNAIQQMPRSHRPRGRIFIEASYVPADKQYPIKIRFTDTGPGIHHNFLDKIFEPMYTTKSQGTGMGLYICRELLARNKGELCVEKTAILVGTIFLIELRKG